MLMLSQTERMYSYRP